MCILGTYPGEEGIRLLTDYINKKGLNEVTAITQIVSEREKDIDMHPVFQTSLYRTSLMDKVISS